ncbi:MAG TPA: ABC transporter ATP-binding protein [Mycobacteriales bacterium]|nr:ABC transporter ATP-binding protein [Mycobacteriales bacterium]
MTAGMALLEIRDLSTDITLGRSVVHALDHVSLTLEAGQTLGIVGESGCGKTMTAMSIEQLLPPGGRIVGGQVVFAGRDLVGRSERELCQLRGREIGMIFQDPATSLNAVQTVGTQVAEPLRLHRGLRRAQARAQAIDMFARVGIPSPARRFDDYPHQLSGGQRQRVMIAMALICEPKLLIADEPTTALDVTIQQQILALIDDLRRELGMAVILVTHDLGVIAGRADRVAVMYAGRIVETAGVAELFAHPRHRYTEALLRALPDRAAGTGERLYSIPGLPPDLTDPPAGCRFAPRCRHAVARCRAEVPPLAGEPWIPPSGEHRYACFVPRPASAGASAGPVQDGGHPGGRPRVARAGWVAPTTPIPADGVALLEVTNLVKDFPVRGGVLGQRRIGAVSAVAGASLRLDRGEAVGLVGESGCGKTTLGRLIVGLEEPSSGQVRFRGRRVDRLRGASRRVERRNVQLMFQDSYASLDPRMRVRSILREPLEIQHVGTPRDRDRRVDELLDAVGLPRTSGERYPHEFSGGQRQRIGLARALALQPGLIVADEPVSALDVSVQAQILNLMKDLQRERELSYLFISHDLAVVRYLTDRIAVMYLGKIVEIGPSAAVYAGPWHPYTKGLIDAVPVADPALEAAKARTGVTGELPSAFDPPSGCRFRTRCPRAQDICARVEPPLAAPDGATAGPTARTGAGPERLVACHFPLVPANPPVPPGPANPSVPPEPANPSVPPGPANPFVPVNGSGAGPAPAHRVDLSTPGSRPGSQPGGQESQQ